MSKVMLIDSAHSEEVRVAIVNENKLESFDFESASKSQIRGNVYLAKVIKVEPSLQAVFVDYGGEKHGFLGFSEINTDYYQIPISDKEELDKHIQNAVNMNIVPLDDDHVVGDKLEDVGEDAVAEDINISKLKYQFYRRYKIQEVIKKRQIMLVQVIKEARGNKGAALTTNISLSGRYSILMPNTSKSVGISRKITNQKDRERLKKIISSLELPAGMSGVIRTAGVTKTKTDIKKDLDYLLKLWDEIRENTIHSSAPCLIHEEANLIKRSIRDLYSKEIDEILVEGEDGYKMAKNFVKKLMPSHTKKVKFYEDEKIPLFLKFNINEQINEVYQTRVNLPSGGYIIINPTEALVAIDVNSGRSTKERDISGTALRTNLEAVVEIARQCRLRDLGGLIVVDFIDMVDHKSNHQVERKLREEFKFDKARIQVGGISNFGLLEFSRQRLHPSISDANSVPCPYCNGLGSVWSTESMAIQVLRRVEEACFSVELDEVKIIVSPKIALYILNNKRTFLTTLEQKGNFLLSVDIDHGMSLSDFKVETVKKSLNFDDPLPELPKTPPSKLPDDDLKIQNETQEVSPKNVVKNNKRRNRNHKKDVPQKDDSLIENSEGDVENNSHIDIQASTDETTQNFAEVESVTIEEEQDSNKPKQFKKSKKPFVKTQKMSENPHSARQQDFSESTQINSENGENHQLSNSNGIKKIRKKRPFRSKDRAFEDGGSQLQSSITNDDEVASNADAKNQLAYDKAMQDFESGATKNNPSTWWKKLINSDE